MWAKGRGMINFKVIRYKNFLSFGDHFTEIRLDKSPTTLITGQNGAGKSTFLDALTFGIYNKPFRQINKPQLINSINKKAALIEIEFETGGKYYMVRRGIKPNIFEVYEGTSAEDIGDESNLLPQDAKVADYQSNLEKNILKMNYQAFTQVVILGKATFVPFMRLGVQERRSVIEDLLGLRIFGTMNKVLKEKTKTLKLNIKEAETSVRMLDDKIENRQRYVDQMSMDRTSRIQDINTEITELTDSNEASQEKLDKLSIMRGKLAEGVEDEAEVFDKQKKLIRTGAKFSVKKSSHEEVIDFFTDNDDCPTCTQPIDDALRDIKLTENGDMVKKLNIGLERLEADQEAVQLELDKIDETNTKIRQIDNKVSAMTSTINSQNRSIKQLNSDITKLNGVSTDKEQVIIDDLTAELKDVTATCNELKETSAYHLNIAAMLKDDGIKTLIINKYLPIFNQLINQFLQKMGFIVKFTLDDQFNEIILSRHRDKFSYNNFSEGQKLRIDLAILMTWREVAKRKNSLSTNLLIMDEVFDSSLDQEGVDAFVDLIPSLGDSNIFIISHTPEKLNDKFRSHMEFKISQNFSVLV